MPETAVPSALSTTSPSNTLSGKDISSPQDAYHRSFFDDFYDDYLGFAQYLHTQRYVYAAYGLLDGMNLAITIPKLMFELIFFNSSLSSVTAFHQFITEPLGILAMVLIFVCLVMFSVLGSYFDESSQEDYQKQLQAWWPYVRDLLKAFKWTFKGVRNTFAAIGGSLHYLILPIGIALIVVSILNRMWYRSMKEERKRMQKENKMQREAILAMGCAFYTYDTLSVSVKNTLDAWFLEHERSGPGNLEAPLPTLPLTHRGSFIFHPTKQTLLYCDETTGVLHPVTMAEGATDSLSQALQLAQENHKKNLIKARLQAIYAAETPLELYTCNTHELATQEKKTPCWVYCNDEKKLHFFNAEGLVGEPNHTHHDHILQLFADLESNKAWLSNLPQEIVLSLIRTHTSNTTFENKRLMPTWETWQAIALTEKTKLRDQSQSEWGFLQERALCSAALGGFTDSLYFYFSMATLTVFIPPLFITMLCLATFLTLTAITARMYEEYEYQRTLSATVKRGELALCIKGIHCILNDLKHLTQQKINTPQNAEPLNQQIQTLLNALQAQHQHYNTLHHELEQTTLVSENMAVLEGIRNGLAVQGVFASIMLAVYTLTLLLGVPCPPLVIILLTFMGVASLFLCIAYAVNKHQTHSQMYPPLPTDDNVNPHLASLLEHLTTQVNQADPMIDLEQYQQILLKKIHAVDMALCENVLAPPPQNLVYEHCENLRLFPSGGSKVPKFFEECCSSDPDYTGIPVYITVAFGFLIGGMVSTARSLAKGFGAIDPPTYVTRLEADTSPIKDVSTVDNPNRFWATDSTSVEEKTSEKKTPTSIASTEADSSFLGERNSPVSTAKSYIGANNYI